MSGGFMLDKNSAGKNIEAYCGKCKLSLDHTIMAMEGDAIARVRCKTCGSWHKFVTPGAPQKIRKPRAKKGAGEESTAEILWETGLAEAKGRETDYSMAGKYRVGDIVNHQTFGKGVVTKISTKRCEMLFKDKERLMVSGN
jgi:hypothetical protein